MNGKIVGVLNIKGGVGKSCIAIHLACGLSEHGKTLLVDADSQGSTRDWNEGGGLDNLSVVAMDRESLDRDIKQFKESFEWIVIDGPVKMEKINAAAIKASDLVIIPIQPSQTDLWATDVLVDLIKARQTVTDGQPAAAFQINRAKSGTKLSAEIRSTVGQWGLNVLDGTIHDRTSFNVVIGLGSVVGKAVKDEKAEIEIKRMVKQVIGAFEE